MEISFIGTLDELYTSESERGKGNRYITMKVLVHRGEQDVVGKVKLLARPDVAVPQIDPMQPMRVTATVEPRLYRGKGGDQLTLDVVKMTATKL